MTHEAVVSGRGIFYGWPANNGAWSWDGGRTLLVGFTEGSFVEQPGHNIAGLTDLGDGYRSGLARSLDGGYTWSVEYPHPFVDNQTPAGMLTTPLDLSADGLALRVIGTGYHGSKRPEGAFLVSQDCGVNWSGPYQLTALMDEPQLRGMHFTGRTAYLLLRDRLLLFAAARPSSNGAGRDRAFVAQSTDGGLSFRFTGWITPADVPFRSVMPAPVVLPDGRLVAALRRRDPDHPEAVCWIDVTHSDDGGATWASPQRVAETGPQNGNPPALVQMPDGSLACVYGDRSSGTMQMRLSRDSGVTWMPPRVLRDDFTPDRYGDMDFGYPRAWVNHSGQLVVAYYWADGGTPEQYIAVTIDG